MIFIAAYVSIPKDLTEVKTRLILNLTKRQVICFSIAGAIGAPMFLLTRGALGNTGGMMLMIFAAMPAFFFAVYTKDTIPAEKYFFLIVRHRIFFPAIRLYKTENLYAYLEEEGKLESTQETTGATRGATKRKRGTAPSKQAGAEKRKTA